MADPKTRKRVLVPAKLKAASPEELRLQIIEAEAQNKQAEVASLRKALRGKIRTAKRIAHKAEVGEASKDAKRLVEHLKGNFQNNAVFTDKQIEAHIPEQIREDVLQDDVNIIFKPHPGPQTDFLAATEKFVLYGGARGGGKSYSLIVDPLRYCNIADSRALILRKTMPELRDLVNNAQRLYKAAYPDVKWREQEKEFRFPSGARIEFGYAENEKDAERYQGQAYTWIGVDEIGLYATDRIFTLLKGSLRSANPNIPTFMRMTCFDEAEILTKEGWKDIRDVTIGELVYSLDSTGSLIFKPVVNIIRQYVEEDLIKINKKNLNISATQDHLFLIEKNGKYISKIPSDFSSSEKIVRAPKVFNLKNEIKIPLDLGVQDYLILLGLFLSEGCTTTRNRVTITQVNQYGHDQIWEFLSKLNSKFRYYTNGDFSVTDGEWYSYFKQFGKAEDKFIPRDVLELNSHLLEYIFDALMFGDGTWQSETSGTFYTTSKQLADDFAELSLKLGYGTKTSEIWRTMPNSKKQYYVHINRRSTTSISKNDIQFTPYKGYVYCVEVPETHTIVVRQGGTTYCVHQCNPGGAGMHWIKEQFVDAAPWNTAFNIPIVNPNNGKITYETRRFIPAKLEDNPSLMQTEDYMNMLLSLPDKLRKMWLEGRWDIIEGAAFEEFDPSVHVVEPFEIPNNWPRFRSCDWGFSTNFCVLWCAVDYENTIWVYREFYGKGLTADIFAQKVRQMEAGEHIQYGVMDSSVWARRGDIGPPIPEIMRKNGCIWRPSDRTTGSRKSGKAELHRRLRIFEDPISGIPTSKLKMFKTCRNLIRTLPALPLDKNDMEDVDTKAEDHAYDALRYGIMSRPIDPIRMDYYQQLDRQSAWQPASKVGY